MASAYWLALQFSDHASEQHKARPQHVKLSDRHAEFVLPATAPSGNKPEGKWKEQVGSPVVVHAWETLTGSIIQEVLCPNCFCVRLADYSVHYVVGRLPIASLCALAHACHVQQPP